MNIRALVLGAFVLLLALAGCGALASQSGTLTPDPNALLQTRVQMVAWIAQGIPSDTLIEFSSIRPMPWQKESIQITADGSATYTLDRRSPEQPSRLSGKLSPEASKSVLLKAAEKRFFNLRTGYQCDASIDNAPCVYDITSPIPDGVRKIAIEDGGSQELMIRINGASNSVCYEPGSYQYRLPGPDTGTVYTYKNNAEADFLDLVSILRRAVKDLPYLRPTESGAMQSTPASKPIGP
jgi:hypothetical protein